MLPSRHCSQTPTRASSRCWSASWWCAVSTCASRPDAASCGSSRCDTPRSWRGTEPDSWQYGFALAEVAQASLWADAPDAQDAVEAAVEAAEAIDHPRVTAYAFAAAAMGAEFTDRPGGPALAARGVQGAVEARDWWGFVHASLWEANTTASGADDAWVRVIRARREQLAALGGPHPYVAWLSLERGLCPRQVRRLEGGDGVAPGRSRFRPGYVGRCPGPPRGCAAGRRPGAAARGRGPPRTGRRAVRRHDRLPGLAVRRDEDTGADRCRRRTGGVRGRHDRVAVARGAADHVRVAVPLGRTGTRRPRGEREGAWRGPRRAPRTRGRPRRSLPARGPGRFADHPGVPTPGRRARRAVRGRGGPSPRRPGRGSPLATGGPGPRRRAIPGTLRTRHSGPASRSCCSLQVRARTPRHSCAGPLRWPRRSGPSRCCAK